MGSFHWSKFMLLNAFVNLHMWLFLIHVWCMTFWLGYRNIPLVKVLPITNICYLHGEFNLILVWCVPCWMWSTNILIFFVSACLCPRKFMYWLLIIELHDIISLLTAGDIPITMYAFVCSKWVTFYASICSN